MNHRLVLFFVLTRTQDELGRHSGIALGEDYAVTYGFDALGRFSTVAASIGSDTSTFSYAYVQGSDILAGWTADTGHSFARAFEPNRNLITGIQNQHGTNLVSSFAYTNDEIGRRTARIDTQPGSTATNDFGYNIRSELISAGMNTNLYSYLYDPIGNRQEAVVNAATNTYTANELNQYVEVANGAAVEPTYDDDGNMTSYNGWTYTWNGENRLILASNSTTVVEYAYDHIGRMVEKTSNGETTSFLWDGYNIIAETGPTATTYNVWGLDLPGSMQGAGGVGGLILVTKHEEQSTTHYAPAYDANGNITEYVDAAGNIAASRTYGPFGETTTSTGAADTFTHWWSTKPWDEVTGFSEYEYRKYLPGLGRWINRDPIEESGGFHLYVICRNNVIGKLDVLGLLARLCQEVMDEITELEHELEALNLLDHQYEQSYLSILRSVESIARNLELDLEFREGWRVREQTRMGFLEDDQRKCNGHYPGYGSRSSILRRRACARIPKHLKNLEFIREQISLFSQAITDRRAVLKSRNTELERAKQKLLQSAIDIAVMETRLRLLEYELESCDDCTH